MARYSKKAAKRVKTLVQERKRGTLRSGSGVKVKSRKQAIAIALSEVHKAGAKSAEEKISDSTQPGCV